MFDLQSVCKIVDWIDIILILFSFLSSKIGNPLTVAYLVMDSNTRSFSGIDTEQIDRQRMARSVSEISSFSNR